MFRDRTDAGRQLAVYLKQFQDEEVLLLAIPRGGVPVGFEVARAYHWPLDLMLTKKLGHPKHKEYAIGAVGLEDRIVVPHSDVTEDYIESETLLIRERLKQMWQKFRGSHLPRSTSGKTIILIDDGLATGQTALAAVQILRKKGPAKIVVAAPVASDSAVEKLAEEADEVIVVAIPEDFFGVGQFYENFQQVSDEEVIADLQRLEEAG